MRWKTGHKARGVLAAAVLGSLLAGAAAEDVRNLTGLPLYPNLTRARMDEVSTTDTLGHWCTRFAAATADSLPVVETWYRKALPAASETNLTDDERYRNHVKLAGVKLALGIDYVAVFRADDQSSTSIELVRCSPVTR